MPTGSAIVSDDQQIVIAAHRLAVQFSDEADLPARFRPRKDSTRTPTGKRDSDIEKRFSASVEAWKELIVGLMDRLDRDFAWRIIQICPTVEQGTKQVSANEDFRRLIDYFIRRRDHDHCSPLEVGELAQLTMAVQREIEKQIPRSTAAAVEPSDANSVG